jgi:hypothetical protein
LSRPDSSLESLAAIPVIHCSSFHFQALKLQLRPTV